MPISPASQRVSDFRSINSINCPGLSGENSFTLPGRSAMKTRPSEAIDISMPSRMPDASKLSSSSASDCLHLRQVEFHDEMAHSIDVVPDAGKFTLNAVTAELTFNQPPDYENPTDANGDGVYEVTVTVSDGTVSATQGVTVAVSDVFENQAPTDIALSNASVDENQPVGTYVGEFNATDPMFEAGHYWAGSYLSPLYSPLFYVDSTLVYGRL